MAFRSISLAIDTELDLESISCPGSSLTDFFFPLITLPFPLFPFLSLRVNFVKDQCQHPLISSYLVNRSQLSSVLLKTTFRIALINVLI